MSICILEFQPWRSRTHPRCGNPPWRRRGDPELVRRQIRRRREFEKRRKRRSALELHRAGPQLLARVPAGRREEGDPTGGKTVLIRDDVFFSSFFWGKHGETANPIFFGGNLTFWGTLVLDGFGRFFCGGLLC